LTGRLEQWWTHPDAFDPERFSPARAEHKRHPFAWIPFGGGAHMCLGLHFAEMQVKAVLHPLLRACRIGVAPGYTMPYQLAPSAPPGPTEEGHACRSVSRPSRFRSNG